MGLFFVSRHVVRRRPLLAERTLRYSCMHVLAVMYDRTDIMLPVYLCAGCAHALRGASVRWREGGV